MFTAVALMCAMENPTSCGVITNGNFFTTEDAVSYTHLTLPTNREV